MNKKHYIIALLICLVILVSSCKKSGASSGTAPRKPFIGGTSALSINFEKDGPPPEVTDDRSFAFNAIVRLKNEGETKVFRDDVKINLAGFDPSDFSINDFDEVRNNIPDNDLDPKRMDAEGNLIEGTVTFSTFPKTQSDTFTPVTFNGNTEFTFRADVCYNYQTFANAKLCVLRDMINVRDTGGICKPSGAKPLHTSSGPVQVSNFRQSVVGKDKLAFTFDILLSSNVEIFWDNLESRPVSDFEEGCPRDPIRRRQRENTVGVEIMEIPLDPIVKSFRCGGLDRDGGKKGTVRLVSGKRTITCTADLVQDRLDLEKNIGINLIYNVMDNKQTKVLVKHLVSS